MKSFDRSHLEVAVEGQNLAFTVHFKSYKAVARGSRCYVTGNHITWPQVTKRDPEVTSFHRKVPGSGCRRPKTRIYCTFHILQGCSSQDEAVMWQEMASRDLRWPEVTRKWCHLTGRYMEVAVESQELTYLVHFTSYEGGCPWEEAVTWQEMMSRDLRWLNVTLNWRHLTESNLEVAVEGQKLAYTVHFSFCKAVARRRRQSGDRKWRHVTSGDRKCLGSDVIWPEVTWKWV